MLNPIEQNIIDGKVGVHEFAQAIKARTVTWVKEVDGAGTLQFLITPEFMIPIPADTFHDYEHFVAANGWESMSFALAPLTRKDELELHPAWDAYEVFRDDFKAHGFGINWPTFKAGYENAMMLMQRHCPKCGEER